MMESLDVWLHLTLHLSNLGEDNSLKTDFEFKVPISMSGYQLKRVILKLCINIWNRLNSEGQQVDEETFAQVLKSAAGHSKKQGNQD